MGNNLKKLLRALMYNKVYSSQTLNCLFASSSVASRCKTQALLHDYIRKTEYRQRERTTHSITLYSLTKRGLNFLLENDEVLSEWLDADVASNLSVLSNTDRRDKTKYRLSQDTMCMTVAKIAGAYIPIDNYTCRPAVLQVDDGITVDDVIAGQLTPEVFEQLVDQTNARKDILYYRGRCIKSFTREKDFGFATQDYAKGRYNGAIISKYKNILMYGAPMFGMSWSDWITKKEYAAFRSWSSTNSVAEAYQLRRSGVCAALVVYNVNEFKNIFLNVDQVNQAGAEFGGIFDHLYIIPLSDIGARHLHWLMTTDDRSMNEEIVEDAINSGAYRKSTKAAPHIFQLENVNEERTALGFHLDGIIINEIRKTALRCPDEQVSVLCYDWQAPYYKAVLPKNVDIEIIDMG